MAVRANTLQQDRYSDAPPMRFDRPKFSSSHNWSRCQISQLYVNRCQQKADKETQTSEHPEAYSSYHDLRHKFTDVAYLLSSPGLTSSSFTDDFSPSTLASSPIRKFAVAPLRYLRTDFSQIAMRSSASQSILPTVNDLKSIA